MLMSAPKTRACHQNAARTSDFGAKPPEGENAQAGSLRHAADGNAVAMTELASWDWLSCVRKTRKASCRTRDEGGPFGAAL